MIDERLKEIGIKLPDPPKPAGSYIPVVVVGNLAFVSGQIPMRDGKVIFTGKVPTQKTVEDAQDASRLCTVNILAQLKANLGNLDRIMRIVKVSGFVNSTQEFTEHPKVINAASDMLYKIFGERGKHARIAVGVSSLPLDSTVEIDLVAEILPN